MNYNPNGQYMPENAPARQPEKKRTWIIVLCVVIGVVLLIALMVAASKAVAASFAGMLGSIKSEGTYYPRRDNIAVVHLSGTISSSSDGLYNHAWLINTINDLTDDRYNKALCLVMNTPGGSVYQTDEIYFALLDYKATGRPIYVYMTELCASGGYYASCAADEIYANRNTLTGSIGVIMSTVYDVRELAEKLGVKVTTVYSGDNKNMGDYFSEFTDEQRAIMQSLCDEAYDQFVSIVADGRHMSEKEVRILADGRVYSAKQAVDNGLIDGIMMYDEFFAYVKAKVEEESGASNLEFSDYEYYYSYSIYDFLNFKAKSMKRSEADVLASVFFENNMPRPSYYCFF